ncbi:MAG: nuclear transport factor 2 family protein [Chthoniobacterales bacterium]|nr:nuclear transport factor 2 family protein [Chthoniobacterales bacterium]
MILPCALIAICALAQAQENPAQEAARLMVEGEGNFFQASQEHGTRAAFLQFLAEEAIVFQPRPVNGREAWRKRPEKGIALSWKPLFAAMARSADLGYTTGPAEWRKAKEDEKPFGYSQFVSIWRKQKDRSWKVALDVGSEVPGPPKADETPQLEFSFGPTPVATNGSQISPSKELHEAESKFAAAAQADSAAALLAASSAAVRVHRENAFPRSARRRRGRC